MLEHDYIEEIIARFVQAIMEPIRRALYEKDLDAAATVETQVAELMSLSTSTAMNLEPNSLCTMMMLSGVGDSIAGYAAWSLNQLSFAYDEAGEKDVAELRRAQAQAIARTFNYDLSQAPMEFEELDAEIREQLN